MGKNLNGPIKIQMTIKSQNSQYPKIPTKNQMEKNPNEKSQKNPNGQKIAKKSNDHKIQKNPIAKK